MLLFCCMLQGKVTPVEVSGSVQVTGGGVTDLGDGDEGKIFGLFAIFIIVGGLLSTMWLLIIRSFAASIITFTIWLNIIFLFVDAVIGFIAGAAPIGVVFLILGA